MGTIYRSYPSTMLCGCGFVDTNYTLGSRPDEQVPGRGALETGLQILAKLRFSCQKKRVWGCP